MSSSAEVLSEQELTSIAEIASKLTGRPLAELLNDSSFRSSLGRISKRQSRMENYEAASLSSKVPGTIAFKRQFALKAHMSVVYGIFLFWQLNSIPQEKKRALRPKMDRLQRAVASVETKYEMVRHAFLLLAWTLILIASFVLPIAWYARQFQFSALTGSWLLAFVCTYSVALYLLLAPITRLSRKLRSIAAMLLWPLFLTILASLQVQRAISGAGSSVWNTAAAAAGLSLMICWAGLIIMIACTRISLTIFRRHKRTRLTHPALADALLLALVKAEKPSALRLDSNFTSEMVVELEIIASLVEQMSISYKNVDPETRSWVCNFYGERAAAIREAKRLLVSSAPNAAALLREKLARLLEFTIMRDFANFPTAQFNGRQRTTNWILWVENVASMLLVGTLVFVVGWWIRTREDVLWGIPVAFIAWSAVWVILLLLSVLKPTAVKNIADLAAAAGKLRP